MQRTGNLGLTERVLQTPQPALKIACKAVTKLDVLATSKTFSSGKYYRRGFFSTSIADVLNLCLVTVMDLCVQAPDTNRDTSLCGLFPMAKVMGEGLMVLLLSHSQNEGPDQSFKVLHEFLTAAKN